MSASPRLWHRPLRGLLITAAAAALVACGGDGDSTTTTGSTTTGSTTTDSTTSTLSGVAAVGSPIVGGTVNVACAGGSALNPVTTSEQGAWQITTSGQTLPCAVQVSGGTVGVGGPANALSLHSVAFDFGTVNITPLTELVLANQLGASPEGWFASPAFAGISATSVQAALANVAGALGISGALDGRNPLTTSFTATSGDAIDDLLEALGAALQTLGQSYASLLAAAGQNNFAAFAGLPAAVAAAQRGGSSGGGSTSCSTGIAATFSKGQAAGPYSDGQQVCISATTTTLSIDNLTLSNPTQNTAVTGEYTAYDFAGTGVGAGLNFELILLNGALFEVNIGKPTVLVPADFHGQFRPVVTGGVTLTLEIAINGTLASSSVIPNQTAPASQTEFCADISSDPNLSGLEAVGGFTFAITGCSFANNVGTVTANAMVSGINVPYTVRFIYGS